MMNSTFEGPQNDPQFVFRVEGVLAWTGRSTSRWGFRDIRGSCRNVTLTKEDQM